MKKIFFFTILLSYFFLYADESIIHCQKCNFDNEKENRYCLNCAEEIIHLSEEKLIEIRKKNNSLSEDRKNNTKKLVENEITNKKLKEEEINGDKEASNENLLGKNLDIFPNDEEFKKIQDAYAPQKKLLIKSYRDKDKKLPFHKVLTPVIVKGEIYYHKSELEHKGLVPYRADKTYFTAKEVHEYHFYKQGF